MRFAFDEEAREFAVTVRGVLEDECTPGDLRVTIDQGWSRLRWSKLAQLGFSGIMVPEKYGGLGLDELSLVLVLEECGRALLPEPAGITVGVLPRALASRSPSELEADWLRKIAGGSALGAAELTGSDLVAGGAQADLLLLRAADQLHLGETSGATAVQQPSLDATRPLATVDWEPGANSLLVEGLSGEARIVDALNVGALAAAAELLGGCQQMLDMAGAHAGTRHQVGRPIGSFQAVKHMLADALLRLEFARPVVYRAAYSMARNVISRSRDVSMAKAMASPAAMVCCRSALQVHGAIGYTSEHDLQLWL